MKTIVLHPERDQNCIARAAAILRRGGLVGIPTETVYGLGADGLNEQAVAAIFAAKGRPQDNPLILHVPDVSWLPRCCAQVPEAAYALAEQFWPGPLTMILPRRETVPARTAGGLDTVGVRCPDHPLTRAIIAAADVPVAAPSGNVSGRPSPTTAAHMLADLDGKIDAVVDGGPCAVGVESTIIDLTVTPPRLLRPGGLPLEALRRVLGEVAIDKAVAARLDDGERPRAPGMKYRHYAPEAPVTAVTGTPAHTAAWIALHAVPGDGVIAFDEYADDFPGCAVRLLGPAADGASHARRVFDALRWFDRTAVPRIYAQCPEPSGMDRAVENRLKKAAGFCTVDAERTLSVIGITGPTGAGKTTALRALERLGGCVIDCDAAYYELLDKSPALRADIEAAFGAVFCGTALDRKKLGRAVFSDPQAMERLNAIVYRHLTPELLERLGGCSAPIAALDAINLVESGLSRLCRCTVAVLAPEEVRIRRIMDRDGVDEAYARLRVGAQKDDAFYRARCTHVLWNDAPDEASFSAEAEKFFKLLCQELKGAEE